MTDHISHLGLHVFDIGMLDRLMALLVGCTSEVNHILTQARMFVCRGMGYMCSISEMPAASPDCNTVRLAVLCQRC